MKFKQDKPKKKPKTGIRAEAHQLKVDVGFHKMVTHLIKAKPSKKK